MNACVFVCLHVSKYVVYMHSWCVYTGMCTHVMCVCVRARTCSVCVEEGGARDHL